MAKQSGKIGKAKLLDFIVSQLSLGKRSGEIMGLCGAKWGISKSAFGRWLVKAKVIHQQKQDELNKLTLEQEKQAALDRLKKDILTKDEYLEMLTSITKTTIAEFHNTWITRKQFEELTDKQKACIESIDTKVNKRLITDPENQKKKIQIQEEWVRIKLYSKIEAGDTIAKLQGWFAPEKHQIESVILKIGYGNEDGSDTTES